MAHIGAERVQEITKRYCASTVSDESQNELTEALVTFNNMSPHKYDATAPWNQLAETAKNNLLNQVKWLPIRTFEKPETMKDLLDMMMKEKNEGAVVSAHNVVSCYLFCSETDHFWTGKFGACGLAIYTNREKTQHG